MKSPKETSEARRSIRAFLLTVPAVAWLFLFTFTPLLIVAAISFFSTGSYGEIERPLTLEHYKRAVGMTETGWDALYPMVLLRSVLLAAGSTAVCLLFALPTAFFLAALPRRWKNAALILITIPLWTNLLVRTYAWQTLLAPGGWISHLWQSIGGSPERLYPGAVAVYIGLVCDYLPFLILPLYASVEKIDWSLAEAARDLGANTTATFRHAIWPQIRPGTFAGLVIVFIPSVAQFVIPDLLGGARTALIGNVIQQEFGPSQNWPFGSAVATVTMLLVLAGAWFYARNAGAKGAHT